MNKSIASQLDWAVSSIASDSARLDAEILLARILGKNRSYLYAWPERLLTEQQAVFFREYVRQRQLGVPVAYIVGEQEFWSLDFYVNPATLIPRPETELLIDAILADCDRHVPLLILDAGTGSGAIAVALAKECPHWSVMACDESEEALWIARQNAVRHHVSVSFHRGDWLQAIADDVLHVVVSNPPYIAPDDEHLPALSYEPHSALVAGNEGYADIMQIATQAFRKLQSGGRFYVEHGFQQAERVREILTAAGFMQVGTARDYAGLERFSYGVKAVDE